MKWASYKNAFYKNLEMKQLYQGAGMESVAEGSDEENSMASPAKNPI